MFFSLAVSLVLGCPDLGLEFQVLGPGLGLESLVLDLGLGINSQVMGAVFLWP